MLLFCLASPQSSFYASQRNRRHPRPTLPFFFNRFFHFFILLLSPLLWRGNKFPQLDFEDSFLFFFLIFFHNQQNRLIRSF
ncbi:hypothetical protein L873DRAFT_1168375 [Choiromyces venosus 120613-1]|uniref:Uncharacterized protein n=1 Tax=Choiromyces venosus 120613-1 TaxID=1336337 RepID=A0A3N4K5F9_9PEZI|nr:hypothetical protein L873DRAFT_1168375 [Choiromyces venosus 120613-1]